MDIKQKIIQKFNAQFGSNLKNLEEIYNFHQHLQLEKDEIEKSVCIFFILVKNNRTTNILVRLCVVVVIVDIYYYSFQSKSIC